MQEGLFFSPKLLVVGSRTGYWLIVISQLKYSELKANLILKPVKPKP